MCFKLTFESENGRRARIDEGKEFHILGADELKASEPVTADSMLMKQLGVSGGQ
jgi:hypothetical protein